MNDNPSSNSGLRMFPSLLGLWFTSLGYTAAISTTSGKRWVDDQTTISVIVGVSLTLLWMFVDDAKMARKVFVYFIVSGLPLLLRYAVKKLQESDV